MHAPRSLLHMKVYVDTDDDVRLARRIQRDVAVRGRDVGGTHGGRGGVGWGDDAEGSKGVTLGIGSRV